MIKLVSLIVILTEKPKVASKIANFLGEKGKVINTDPLTIEILRNNEKIIIVPALGHLLNLETDEKGYPVFKTYWKPIDGIQKKYLLNACNWLKKAEKIYIATDYDLEGELIAYNILKYCQVLDKKIFRMKFSSLTKNEIIKAFNNPTKIDKNLVAAGTTRHILDWIYGINFSRALMSSYWKYSKNKEILSIGRVQGAILRLIYEREKEIESFKSKFYWTIKVKDLENNVIFQNNKKYEKEEEAKKIFDLVKKSEIGLIINVELKKEKIKPFPNFNLTDLQEEAYKLFRIKPSKTLKILQELYEEGFITYPRTSSQKLPDDEGYLNKILQKLSKIIPLSKDLIGKKPVQGSKDDPAHPAIHPTGNIPKNLSKEQELIYNLVLKRFISSFLDSAEILIERVTLVPKELKNKLTEDFKFFYLGRKLIKKGFLEVYDYYKIEENFVGYKKSQELKIKALLEKNKTKPPSRYNQGQLMKVLEQKKIGTKATRAQILETLYNRGYLIGENPIKITSLGKKVVEIMIKYLPKIVDLEMTKELEESLEKIQEGKENPKEILKRNIELVKESALSFKEKEDEIGKELIEERIRSKEKEIKEKAVKECECGGKIIIKESKQGKKFLGCTNWPKCKKTFSLPKYKRLLKSKCKSCGARLFSLENKKKYCVFCNEYYG